MNPRSNLLRRSGQALMLAGPGLFCVGYTIGTGAITKLSAAGNHPSLQVLSALLGSCVLFWVLIEASGRYAVVTGGTALNGFRNHLPGGLWLAPLILVGVLTSQLTGLPAVTALVSRLVHAGLQLVVPSIPDQIPGAAVGIAAALLGSVYLLLLTGRFALFEKVLAFLVTVMVAGFLGAMYLAGPAFELFPCGPAVSTPTLDGGLTSAMAVAGLALAAPTFLVRTLLVRGKEWRTENIREQRRDALVAAGVFLVIGVSIVACVAGALHPQEKPVQNLFEAIHALEGTAGRLAAGFFVVGVLAAGLSSMIPMTMVLPLLIEDYTTGELHIRTRQFRTVAALACIVGLTGAIFEERLLPIHRIGSQLAQLFVLPLTVGGILMLLNRKELMGGHRAGLWLNAGLVVALGFAVMTSGISLIGLWRIFD